MNDLLKIQADRNSQTFNNWERSRTHRDTITNLLMAHTPNSLLRVFGAGNCNDLDLQALSSGFTSIELIDIDPTALSKGVQRQGILEKQGIRQTSDIDLSGNDYRSDTLADVSLSACLFTQLLEQLDSETVRSADGVASYRRDHLEMLIKTTKPGGTAYFVTDMVSDLTVRQLSTIAPAELNGFLSTLIERRNFFTGTNPFPILEQLKTDARIASSELLDAWIWKLGPRIFAVYGIRMSLAE